MKESVAYISFSLAEHVVYRRLEEANPIRMQLIIYRYTTPRLLATNTPPVLL